MPVRKKVAKVSKVSKVPEEQIKSVAQELLAMLLVEGSVEVTEDKENEVFNVQIETDQAGILIGHRGETLSSFQIILKQIVFNQGLADARLVVNVGDWKDKREETLKAIAQSAVSKVRNMGTPAHIYDLSPADRRFVHILLSEEPEVVTESEGEGRDRHLVVKPK